MLDVAAQNSYYSMLMRSGLVADVCRPLFINSGIRRFSYVEIHKSGEFLFLDSDANIFKQFIDDGYVQKLPLVLLRVFPKVGNYIIDFDSIVKSKVSELLKCREKKGYGHPFRIVDDSFLKSEGIIRGYVFDANCDDEQINYFYLNNIDLLKQFTDYFWHRVIYPFSHVLKKIKLTGKEKSEVVRHFSKLNNPYKQTRERILMEIKVNKYVSSNMQESRRLTGREKDVMLWHIRGKTAEETAIILNISKRTVEYHFQNLRKKFGISSKNQIALQLIAKGLLPFD